MSHTDKKGGLKTLLEGRHPQLTWARQEAFKYTILFRLPGLSSVIKRSITSPSLGAKTSVLLHLSLPMCQQPECTMLHN